MSDTTSPERWRRIKAVAAAAWDCDESARLAYVDAACAGDEALRSEVVSLLASATAATPFFETPGGGSGASMFSTGSRIGPYRLIRELASGGMGSVYLAERDDGEFRQRVAIKVVRGGFANTFLLHRFREERRILASLEHPNIARLLDGGATESGLPYVAMEYIEGEAIDSFCRTRQLKLRDRLAVFRQVCAAVEYAHRRLIIHRDIKAANILMTADGTPKLLDFGIAKLLDPDTGLESPRHTTVRVMTPESASPEQIAGAPLTVATDVYALGVLLYRLLTDRSPYDGPLDNDADLMRAVRETTPPLPSALPNVAGARIPHDIDMIVMKALRKEPERRYGSAEQLSNDIQNYLEGRPVLAAPDSLRYRTAKFLGRHRVAAPAVLAVVLATALGVAATLWQARVAERERMRADAQRARAERQFNAVRGLARSVLGELHTAVTRLPGSTAAREILLRRATEYLDALSAESKDNLALRREVAEGYLELATVQGAPGMPNLGDGRAMRTSLEKAVALLDPVAGPSFGEVADRLALASGYTRLANAGMDPVTDRERALIGKARALVEGVTGPQAETAHAFSVRQEVWDTFAQMQLDVPDYPAARTAYEQVLAAAQGAYRLAPGRPLLSRNLSLAYKKLGAVLEVMNAPEDVMPLYEKAMELDRARVAAEPSRPIWRLDLSFSYGAIGAALMAKGDLDGALARYTEAVRLREQVVADDPDDDFAKVSLARGYERLAMIASQRGDIATAFLHTRARLDIFRRRLAAHPDRDNLWREYSRAAFAAATSDLGLLESPTTPSRRRRAHAAEVAAILDEITATRERWVREKRSGTLPPADADLDGARERLRALSRR